MDNELESKIQNLVILTKEALKPVIGNCLNGNCYRCTRQNDAIPSSDCRALLIVETMLDCSMKHEIQLVSTYGLKADTTENNIQKLLLIEDRVVKIIDNELMEQYQKTTSFSAISPVDVEDSEKLAFADAGYPEGTSAKVLVNPPDIDIEFQNSKNEIVSDMLADSIL
jgi:hypothetical protein